MFQIIKESIKKVFRRGNKGCLYGKTEKQKHDFFMSLSNFATTDPEFFKEQYTDLLPHEQSEFIYWTYYRQANLMTLKAMCNALKELLKEKHQKDNSPEVMPEG